MISTSLRGGVINPLVTRLLGNGVTSGDDLDRVAKKIFGNVYQGIRTTDNLPLNKEIKNNTFYIVWKGVEGETGHWMSIWKKNGKPYEFDSYESEDLSPEYINYNIPNKERQTVYETNCGEQVLSRMMKVFDIKSK